MRYTYNLNEYFTFDFGDYRTGCLDFQLPSLDDGHHELTLRAWDVLNHSSVVSLTFVTGPQYSPSGIIDVNRETINNNRYPITNNRYYDLQGRNVSNPSSRQLLIVRSQDGKVKKKIYRKQ